MMRVIAVANSLIIGLAITALTLGSGESTAQTMPSTKAPTEIAIGPIDVTRDVVGVPLHFIVKTYLKVETRAEGLFIAARVVGDLGDLQAKVGQLIDTIPLPRNNCRSFSANNPVVTIWGKRIEAIDDQAVLQLNGDIDVWDCRENPIPKVTFEDNWINIGPLRTKGPPHVHTEPGDPIKNKIVKQPFDASLAFSVYPASDQVAKVRLGDPKIVLGGPYATITNGILTLAGVNINAEAEKSLSAALDPNMLTAVVPSDYADLHPKVEQLTFTSDGGRLAVVIQLSAQVPPERLTALIQTVVKELKPS